MFRVFKNQDSYFEVIIIDNGSNDDSKEFIKDNYPEYTLIENTINYGFSMAVNQGIMAFRSDYVFLLNNDVVLEEDCISKLLNCIKNDDNIFAVASKMIRYDDRGKLDDAGDEYSLLGWTRKMGDGKSINGILIFGRLLVHVQGQLCIGGVFLILLVILMRIFLLIWRMLISVIGLGFMVINAFIVLMRLFIIMVVGLVVVSIMNLK